MMMPFRWLYPALEGQMASVAQNTTRMKTMTTVDWWMAFLRTLDSFARWGRAPWQPTNDGLREQISLGVRDARSG